MLAPLVASEAATFDVPGSAEEGARLLKNVTASPIFPSFTRQSLVGRITDARVTLWRHRPFVQNSFIPVFKGQFLSRGGRTVLAGHFRMHAFTRFFMMFWFSSLLVFWGVAMVNLPSATNPSFEKVLFAFVPLLMFLFGLALLHFGRWLSRGDIAFLRQAIKGALHGGGT